MCHACNTPLPHGSWTADWATLSSHSQISRNLLSHLNLTQSNVLSWSPKLGGRSLVAEAWRPKPLVAAMVDACYTSVIENTTAAHTCAHRPRCSTQNDEKPRHHPQTRRSVACCTAIQERKNSHVPVEGYQETRHDKFTSLNTNARTRDCRRYRRDKTPRESRPPDTPNAQCANKHKNIKQNAQHEKAKITQYSSLIKEPPKANLRPCQNQMEQHNKPWAPKRKRVGLTEGCLHVIKQRHK